MEQVTVRIIDLLGKLKANRETHQQTYELARDGFRKQAIEMFKKELHLAESGWEFRSRVYLEPPEDHTKDYDNAIEMLEGSGHRRPSWRCHHHRHQEGLRLLRP